MPETTRIAGPVKRPAYRVTLTSLVPPCVLDIEARNLDHLADLIEHEVTRHTTEHVGIRLDGDGSVWVRLGWAASFDAGRWTPAQQESTR